MAVVEVGVEAQSGKIMDHAYFDQATCCPPMAVNHTRTSAISLRCPTLRLVPGTKYVCVHT